MSDKQIFAALEIADHEVRLIVSELHNLKFNVLKVERIEIAGIDKLRIIDEQNVISGIKKAVMNAEKMIGASIQKVLLVVPSLDFSRLAKRITVALDNNRISIKDIQKALMAAMSSPLQDNKELVNFGTIRYIVNGFVTRRLPVNEKAESLAVEVDLLAANKDMVWEYVKCVEKADLEIIDIYLDTYAFSSEAALFERAIGHYVLAIRYEQNTTTLTLLANGRIESSVVINKGYGEIVDQIVAISGLSVDIAKKLLLHNCRLKGKVDTSPIYLWSHDNKTFTISETEMVDIVKPLIDEWIEEIRSISQEILANIDILCVLYGEGSQILQLNEVLSEELDHKFSVYIPETLGVRNSSLATCIGLFYCYRDQELFRGKNLYSINSDEFVKMINAHKTTDESEKEETLTNRFKKLFK